MSTAHTNYRFITEKMITNQLGLSIDAPSLKVWEALYSKCLAHRKNYGNVHIQDLNYSSRSKRESLGALYLVFQVVGEIILDFESKGVFLFEDNSTLSYMELDSNYTYDDGCCIFSNFQFIFHSTTSEKVYTGWGIDGSTAVADTLDSLDIRSMLGEIFGEDSFYASNFPLLQQLSDTSHKSSAEFPTGIGCAIDTIFNRHPKPYPQWLASSLSTDIHIQQAIIALFGKAPNFSQWAGEYIPTYPQLINMVYPVNEQNQRRTLHPDFASLNVPTYSPENLALQCALHCPTHSLALNADWRFFIHEWRNLPPEQHRTLLEKLPNLTHRKDSLHWLVKEGLITELQRFIDAIFAGCSVQEGQTVDHSEVIFLEEVPDLEKALALMPNAKRVDLLKSCKEIGNATHPTLESISLDSTGALNATASTLNAILHFWEQSPKLEQIHGKWMMEVHLTSRSDIEELIKAFTELRSWMNTQQFAKVNELITSQNQDFVRQGIELWHSLRPNSTTELNLFVDSEEMLLPRRLGWSNQQTIKANLNLEPVSSPTEELPARVSYSYHENAPTILDLSNNPNLKSLDLYAQPNVQKIILKGCVNIEDIRIDGVNFLEEIIGLEDCTSLTKFHLEDSSHTHEHQNEKWGYYESSGQFSLTRFNWAQFKNQLEQLSALQSLFIRSSATNLQGCVLPQSLTSLCVFQPLNHATFPDGLRHVYLGSATSEQCASILELPNIESVEIDSPVTLPASSVVGHLSVGAVSNPEVLSTYNNLQTLHMSLGEEHQTTDPLSYVTTVTFGSVSHDGRIIHFFHGA